MDIKKIGQYIQYLRKQKGLSQKDLAERLSVTFQAVSKWETGENLPDASILLELAEVLETTTDKILGGGYVAIGNKQRVNIDRLKEGLLALRHLRDCFGYQSSFYLGAIEGIKERSRINIEDYLQDEAGQEILLAEAVVQCLSNGYYISENDIKEHFSSEEIRYRLSKYSSDSALFADKANNYVDYRPSYPKAIADLIFSMVEDPVIADIGSGTGKLSQILLDRAKLLYAVEPNKQMRKKAESLLSGSNNYISIGASAESTKIPDQAVDIITVAEAYHWFDNDPSKLEFQRILKEDGFVFLMWNRFGGDPYDEEKSEIEGKYRGVSKIDFEERAIHLFGRGNYETVRFDNSMQQTYDEFIGGWSSASFIPKEGTVEYTEFKKKATELFRRHSQNGHIYSTVTTVCFYGKLLK